MCALISNFDRPRCEHTYSGSASCVLGCAAGDVGDLVILHELIIPTGQKELDKYIKKDKD